MAFDVDHPNWSECLLLIHERKKEAREDEKFTSLSAFTEKSQINPSNLTTVVYVYRSQHYENFNNCVEKQNLKSQETEPQSNTSCYAAGGNKSSTNEIVPGFLEDSHPKCYQLRAYQFPPSTDQQYKSWFINPSALPLDAELDISNVSLEFLSDFLQYLIRCGVRVSQMTRTYDDKDALISLLREKEEDLELAARIGQSLLEQNKKLQEKNEAAEHDLSSSLEMVTQLKHELAVKDKILKLYTQESDTESESGAAAGTMGFNVHLDALNKRVASLEEENRQLKTKTCMNADCLKQLEEREKQLVDACVKEMSDLNEQLNTTQKERLEIEDEVRKKEEEIADLISKIEALNQQIEKLNQENAVLQFKLEKAVECQHALATELIEFQEKYQKLLTAFQELQDEAKRTERSHASSVTKWNHGMEIPRCCPDSLASELELSLHNALLPLGENFFYRRVFETVRCANRSACEQSLIPGRCFGYPIYSSSFQPLNHVLSCTTSLNENSDTESAYGESYQTDDDSQYSSLSSMGMPGTPATTDFEVTARRPTSTSATETTNPETRSLSDFPTPNSPFSSERPSTVTKHYKLSNKLQIVKPLEGSQTLQHWQKLASPNLCGIFEQRPGIQAKAEKKVSFLDDVYSLADVEEDEEIVLPGKSFEDTNSVFSYVTSSVHNSGEQTRVTPSSSLQMSFVSDISLSSSDSRQEEKDISRSPLNLHKVLSDHGIHGVIPTKDDLKADDTPPTPPPSPQRSRPSSPDLFDPLKLSHLIKHSQITRSCLLKSPSQSKVDESPPAENTTQKQFASGLMDKLNKIGLKNIIMTTSHPSSASCALIKSAISTNCASVKLSTISDNVPLTSSIGADAPPIDSLALPVNSCPEKKPERPAYSARSYALHHPWGFVPALAGGRGLSLAVSPPLSRMPNPILQLNSFSCLGLEPAPDVGTLRTLHILRKGGYA